MASQINVFENQHISDEVKKADDKVKKTITDILTAKQNSLLHNKSVLDDLETEASYFREKDCYLDSWLLFSSILVLLLEAQINYT